MEIFKYYRHNPPHLFRDGAMYMVTAGTYQRQTVINKDERKMFWYDTLKYLLDRECWRLYAWVVLDNHYHVLIGEDAVRLGKDAKSGDLALRRGEECNDSSHCVSTSATSVPVTRLSSIISSLHKFTSRQWNIQDKVKGRKVWWNYWDTCITNEGSCYSRINYIHWNPVKHGYTSLPEQFVFSSYNAFFEMDKYSLKEFEERYPFDRVSIMDDF